MSCPRCGLPGRKVFKGYCTKVHQKLDAPPKFLQLSCANCGNIVVRSPSSVSKGGKVYCKRCNKNTGENHPNWKEGQYINPAGYRLILINREYQLEHKIAWEQANKACILKGARGIVIHHLNMVKTDNRPENLVLLTDKVHGRIHRLIDAERFEDAKWILVRSLEQQVFFLLHSEHLERIRKSSLQDILSGTQEST